MWALTLSTLTPTAAPGRDTEALFREARRRRRQRRVGWVLVGVLVIAATTLVAASRQTPPPARAGQRTPTSRGALAPRTPANIVGWTSTSKLVVISSHTGRLVRTLASDVSIFAPGLPIVSVAPDGTVFFESATPSTVNPNSDQGDQILSVPITGGVVRDLGPGSDPQVSPNGRFLAYISPDPVGEPGEAPFLVPPVGIDIARLSSGTIGATRTVAPGPAQVNQGASDLSWSSDSRQVSFDLLNPATNVTTAWTINAAAAPTSLASATEIVLQTSGLTWNGYWGKNENGADIGLGTLDSGSGRQEIVSVNPSTGRVIDRLFHVPDEVCTATFPGSPPGCSSLFSNDVIGDSAGTDVLVAGAIPFVDGSVTTSGAAHLYRWHVGDRAPTRLLNQVLVASWGPPKAS
jgi:hypothetical protein